MNTLVIPVNVLQKTIHLQGRCFGMLDLLKVIEKDNLTTMVQVKGAIHNIIDESKAMINEKRNKV